MPRPNAHPVHPFAMLLDPAAVLTRIEHSERLQGLARHVCRPLDTLRPGPAGLDDEAEAGDEPRWVSRDRTRPAADAAPPAGDDAADEDRFCLRS